MDTMVIALVSVIAIATIGVIGVFLMRHLFAEIEALRIDGQRAEKSLKEFKAKMVAMLKPEIERLQRGGHGFKNPYGLSVNVLWAVAKGIPWEDFGTTREELTRLTEKADRVM